jgi:hypothetical protein
MASHMLTTVDNPFNPFTHYAEWVNYDEQLCGYYTNSYLARIARVSDELSDADFDVAYENAVDEIVRENINGLYRKVSEPETSTAAA